MRLRATTCVAMAAARLVELAYSRRNLARSGPAERGTWSSRTYPAVIALHAAVILGTLLRGRRRVSWLPLLALLAVQPLRVWVLVTLGSRWNTRGAVPAAMEVETGGPYGYVRHPNYAVIAMELAALPVAFGLRRFAIGASVANAALLAIRIRDEEGALFALPGYAEHFGRLKRFVPGIL